MGLGSKSPNLQSPQNISVSKPMGVVDPLTLGSLPSSIAMSIPNSAGGLQSMAPNVMSIANNGSSPNVMSSIQGTLHPNKRLSYKNTEYGVFINISIMYFISDIYFNPFTYSHYQQLEDKV